MPLCHTPYQLREGEDAHCAGAPCSQADFNNTDAVAAADPNWPTGSRCCEWVPCGDLVAEDNCNSRKDCRFQKDNGDNGSCVDPCMTVTGAGECEFCRAGRGAALSNVTQEAGNGPNIDWQEKIPRGILRESHEIFLRPRKTKV